MEQEDRERALIKFRNGTNQILITTDLASRGLDIPEIQNVIQHMTDIMVHDITNPPLAARFFSYACLSGYEVVAQNDTAFHLMHSRINDYPKIEKPTGINSHFHVGVNLIYFSWFVKISWFESIWKDRK